MSASMPTSSATQPIDEFLSALDSALQGAFDVPFDLWLRDPSWRRWEPEKTAAGEHLLSGDPSGVIDALEEAVESADVPIVRTRSDGRHLIAIPIQDENVPPMVAVAILSMTPQELLQRLAGSFQKAFHQCRELETNRRELDSCTEQLSMDLERLSYLHGLAEHLELCDISRSVDDIARVVLPPLRELIHAETLVFVSAFNGSERSSGETAEVGAAAVWVGPQLIDNAACCKLVDDFKDAVARQPVIKNRLSEETAPAGCPGVKCFLLTRVAKDESCAGWLLALNRVTAAGTDGQRYEYPSWGLSDYEFGTVEAGLMGAAGSMLSTHGHNVELFHEKESLLVGVVRALINTIDAKDSYTCGHSDRVALIAKRLGEELGLDHQECEELYLVGLLHDIGKIAVPDEVLRKPTKLTDAEFSQVKRHPQRGCAILQHLEQLGYVMPGVLHHHERYDGKGYPLGLANEKIPLSARIVGVADAYDAMSSRRPYRAPVPPEKVEAIFREGAGTQWDGRIVEAFLRALPEIRDICEASVVHTLNLLAPNECFPKDHDAVGSDSVVAAVSTMHTK